MKTVVNFILLSYLALYASDYEKLAKSKEEFKKSRTLKKAPRLQNEESKYKSYIEIIHNDVTENEINMYRVKYRLKLYKCIAKNICIYIYTGDLIIAQIIENIRERENIKAVYDYDRRKMDRF